MTPKARPKKKRKAELGKLSFAPGAEELDEDEGGASEGATASTRLKPKPTSGGKDSSTADASTDEDKVEKRRLGPDASVAVMPKVVTKSTLLKDAQMREKLRKEFLLMQKAVRATEMAIPFVFYDGTNIPGGICKVKKGNHVWLFLDKARKVGAERGVGGAGERASSKREWARVGVDDLLLVRGEVIIPHVSVAAARPPNADPTYRTLADPSGGAALRVLLLRRQPHQESSGGGSYSTTRPSRRLIRRRTTRPRTLRRWSWPRKVDRRRRGSGALPSR